MPWAGAIERGDDRLTGEVERDGRAHLSGVMVRR